MSFTRIALRNVPRRKLRNSLTVGAIIISIALLIGVNIAANSAINEFGKLIVQATGDVDVLVTNSTSGAFSEQGFQNIVSANIKGVSNVAGRLSITAFTLQSGLQITDVTITANNASGYTQNLAINGLNTTSDYLLHEEDLTNITGQRNLGVNSSDIIVSDTLGLNIGENITIHITKITQLYAFNGSLISKSTRISNYTFNIVGIYHPSVVERRLGFGAGSQTTNEVFMDLLKSQTMLNYTGRINSFMIKISDSTNQTLLSNIGTKIEQILGPGYVVSFPKETSLQTISQTSTAFEGGLNLAALTSMVVAIGVVIIAIYLNVNERTYEIGVLRSIGASTGQIFWMFFSESLVLGVLGIGLGLAAGVFLAQFFLGFASHIFNVSLPFSVTSQSLISNFTVGIIAGLVTVIIGGTVPSLLAIRVNVIRALRPSMRPPGKPRTALKLILIGLLIIAGSILFGQYVLHQTNAGLSASIQSQQRLVEVATDIFTIIGLVLVTAGFLRSGAKVIEHVLTLFSKKSGKLISRNIGRNLMLNTACFTLIALSLSFVVGMGSVGAVISPGLNNVVHNLFGADIFAAPKITLPASFGENNLSKIQGVNLTTPIYIIPSTQVRNSTKILAGTVGVIAIDPDSYHEISPIKISSSYSNVTAELDENGTALLPTSLAEDLGVTVGNTFGIQISTNRWVQLKLVGILEEAALQFVNTGQVSLSRTVYVSFNTINETWKRPQTATLFFISVKKGYSRTDVKNNILSEYGNYFTSNGIVTLDDVLSQVSSQINRIIAIFYGIVLFSILIATLGMAIIMIMNVSGRRREIAILKSQGMNNREVFTLIGGEALVLGIIGFIIGALGGVVLFNGIAILMQTLGFPIPFTVTPGIFIDALILAVAVSICGVAYPAYEAIKLSIIEALRYKG
ncbi:MAG TPA: FtsX-like permease family protein [archaeon]|nr:FtsX-like permease family protein [archaeon]